MTKYWINYYVNIDLCHQYGISAAESQMFLSTKRPQLQRARRNRCFRRLLSTGLLIKPGADNQLLITLITAATYFY